MADGLSGADVFDAIAVKGELVTAKLGIGVAPVASQSAYTQTYATASRTHPAPTATLAGVDTGTDMTAAQAATIVADILALNKLIVSLIDDLQAIGISL